MNNLKKSIKKLKKVITDIEKETEIKGMNLFGDFKSEYKKVNKKRIEEIIKELEEMI